jgi:hypothetical protein
MRVVWRSVVSGLVIAGVAVGAFGIGWASEWLERDRNFVIDAFAQHVAIDASGDTRVTEVIDVTFTSPRRGIFRDLDQATPFPSAGSFRIIQVDQGDPARPWTFTTESGPTGPRVRIGDADVFLTPGTYRYRIVYDAPSWYYVPRSDPDLVEVRIDAPGFDWPTTIGSTTISLELPGTVRATACVEGPRRTTQPCRREPMVSGNRAIFPVGPFGDHESATVAAFVDRDAFTAAVPAYAATPLGEGLGILQPWPLDRAGAALLLALALMVPLLAWETVSAWLLYRDRETDPALHHRQHPTAIPAPPHGLRPPEVAGLLLRTDADDLFLAALVDLDQRGAIESSSSVVPGKWLKRATETLTVRRGADGGTVGTDDRALVSALVPSGPTIFDGEYDKRVADRVEATKALLNERAADVFVDHGFAHEEAGAVGRTGFRVVMGVLYLLFAGLFGLLLTYATPLHPASAVAIVVLVLLGWALARAPWRHHRVPLNSAGRDAVGQARSFREFVRTVEGEQLEWAAGQPGIDHHHPAVSLLPYSIALGLSESWYERFGSVMRELAVAGAGGAAAAGTTWWASQSSFGNVRASQAGTSTAPSSSSGGGGGGGGGSGGGGGGGGSW